MPESKRALVVDDSKSARLVLRRMLERHGLVVDTVESAREALDYLTHNHPNVIFMDHMMPGMDGFEAVKAIKQDPQTATIPIMMYTSKGGDLYLGQARALGAVGILPKTVAPAELFDSLQRLGLVEERRTKPREQETGTKREPQQEQASERSEDIQKRAIHPPPFLEPGMQIDANAVDADQLETQLRRLLEEQRVELRKDLLLSLETVSRQTGNRFNKELDEKLEILDRTQPPPARETYRLPLAIVSVLLLVSLAWNFLPRQAEEIASTPAATNDVQAASDGNLEETVSELKSLQMETVSLLNKTWDSLDWAMNQSMFYAYDEIALDDERVDLIEELLQRLASSGFRGTVTVQTHAGEFCLLGNQEDGFRLPPPDGTLGQCEFMGNPVQAVDSPAAHQSLRFANFYNSTPLLDDSPFSLDVIALPRSDPLQPYPAKSEDTTVQEWNRAAAANNRILIRLTPQLR